MNSSKLGLSVFCLLLGGALGYGLRSTVEAAGKSKSESATVAGATEVRTLSPSPSKVKASEGQEGSASPASEPSQKGSSMGERIDLLLTDFNFKTAQKTIEGFSVSEVQAALALSASKPKGYERDALRKELYRAWTVFNSSAAWKAASADPLDEDRGYYLSAVAGEMAKKNGPATIDAALQLGVGAKRTAVLTGALNDWGKLDPDGAIDYWNSHPDLPLDGYAMSSVIYTLGQKDPGRAASLAMKFKDNRARNSALSGVAQNWAAKDPAAALNWAQSLAEPAMREKAVGSALRGWSQNDPKSALAHVQAMPQSGLRNSEMSNVWQNWLRKNPQEALAYLGTVKDDPFTSNVGWTMASTLDNMTPQEKKETLARLPEGKMKEDVVQNLVSNQIDKGRYNQALEYLNVMPDSGQRDYAVQKLGKEWAASDPAGAAAWLKLQPDSSDRDLAVSGFVGVLALTNPREAVKWINTIPDESVREGSIKNLAHSWLSTDPAGAEAWMASIKELSDSEKDRLRKVAKLHRPSEYSHGVSVSKRR